jgi:hypothetical protein
MKNWGAVMFRSIVVCLTLLALSGTAFAEKFKCGSARGFSPYDIQPISGEYDHLRFAPANAEKLKNFGPFVASMDGSDDANNDGNADLLAVPHWVAYELVGVKEDNGKYREPEISIDHRWYKHNGLDFLWTDRPGVKKRKIDDSYSGIGAIWNRGHLAMADHAQRYGFADAADAPRVAKNLVERTERSWQASCNTHIFWNAVPQAAEMNQGPWLHLETYVAALSNKYGRVWTIAGPIFHQNKPIMYIGDDDEVPVAIPHALFKILVVEIDGKIETRAFVFDQEAKFDNRLGVAIPTKQAKKAWVKCTQAKKRGHVYNHSSRLKTLAAVEELTGLRFMPNQDGRDEIAQTSHSGLWPVEPRFWSGYICGGQNFVSSASTS